MRGSELSDKRLRFGVFEADLRTGELTKQGKRLRLQDQPFQLLALLLEQHGELVTREELRGKLWPNTTVDFEHGLNKAVSKIREALGDSAENPRFVETVARRGYRFLADVTVAQDGQIEEKPDDAASRGLPAAPEIAPVAASSGTPARDFRLKPIGAGLAVLLVIALCWTLFIRAPTSPKIHSLAVLPLDNLSGDASQEYFADGMTEELIAHLAQIRSLRVISRTSVMTYKNVRKPLPQISRELNVDAVVEGSVLRSGDRVRITAQLIRVPDETHLWTKSYDENVRDTLSLQGKVTQDIAEQIQVALNEPAKVQLGKPATVNQEAYEDYLKGRYFWNKRSGDGLRKSIEYFNRAIEKDANFARAYAGLADTYALSGDWEYGILSPDEAFSKAKIAAAKALALDDSLSEAHTSLAFAMELHDWDWNAAGTEYQRALALNPGYATAHHWYAWHLILMRRIDEGLLALRKAESLDPLSLIIGADLADALCVAHLYDASLQQSQKMLDLDPTFAIAHYQRGQAFEQKQMHEQAIAEFQKAIELAGHSAAFDSNLAHAYAMSGHEDEARKIAKELETHRDQYPSAEANIALIYVGLHEPDHAIDWLNKAYDARFNPSILLRPGFDPLRSDHRFQALWRRIGLP